MEEDYLSDSYIMTKYHNNDTNEITIDTPKVFEIISKEKICCIELVNNNKVYIKYELNWTIADVRRF
jgi:hypothetical protein